MATLAATYSNPSYEWQENAQRILIVDDEELMRTSLRLLLEGEDRVVLESATGLGAIDILTTQKIDLLLLDIHLPDISGLEVMEWIAGNHISTSVIIVSADAHIDSAIRATRSGAVNFVRKPHELDKIGHTVANILHRRSLDRRHVLMTARLEQSERLHRFLVESSPDLIYTLDHEGRFIFVNSRVESLLGYSRDELIGNFYTVIVHEEDLEQAIYAFTERRSDDRAISNREIRLKCKDNHYRQFENRYIVAMLSAMGIYESPDNCQDEQASRFMGTYGVARDVSERKRAEETISFQAMHDHLTHLPNRRLFKDRLDLAMAHTLRKGGVIGVMFIDLDRFKLANDTYGHAEGDELLKNVAQRLLHCVRVSDTLARQGGDEFTILLPNLVLAEDATLIAKKIMEQFATPFIVAGHEFRASASIGIAIFPRDGDSADLLLKHADIAMYKVKSSGKNGYAFFTREMSSSYQKRISLENELHQAIRNKEFELHYQTQINITCNRIVGLEALVRWQHPLHGLLNPDSFIDLVEELGLISSITDWVLDEACRQLVRWRAMGMNDLRIAVNVSPQEFNNDDVVERIVSQLNRYHLPEEVLDIEITENLLMHDDPHVISKLRRLRERGIRISIDDFGTRYSSLNYLRRFPVNTIKIDKSFIRDLDDQHDATPIIHAIIGIARGFGLHLLAEGVETSYQMRILRELGCEEMQGFFFSKPLPAEKVELLLLEALKQPIISNYKQQNLCYFGEVTE
ncbi:MAG TPA: EAL domain-containing protein [Desulfuromonadales bacterium]|nr:EAL domain-containing protein [Desulfuromonadales bacterium]